MAKPLSESFKVFRKLSRKVRDFHDAGKRTTFREVCHSLDLDVNAAHYHIRKLHRHFNRRVIYMGKGGAGLAVLTPFGGAVAEVLRMPERLKSDQAAYREKLKELNKGTFRVSTKLAGSSFFISKVAPAVLQCLDFIPEIITMATPSSVLPSLLQGDFGIAVGGKTSTVSEVGRRHLLFGPIARDCLAVHLAIDRNKSPDDLPQIVITSKASAARWFSRIVAWALSNNWKLLTFDTFEAAEDAARSGLGFAIVPFFTGITTALRKDYVEWHGLQYWPVEAWGRLTTKRDRLSFFQKLSEEIGPTIEKNTLGVFLRSARIRSGDTLFGDDKEVDDAIDCLDDEEKKLAKVVKEVLTSLSDHPLKVLDTEHSER